MPSLSMTSSVASPCVIEIGLPPNVLKWTRFVITRAISGRVTHAPSGAPLPIPLAIVTRSGVTPQFSKPQKAVPGPAEAGLDLVGDAQAAVLADDVVDDLEVFAAAA